MQLGQFNVPTDIADKIRITANEFNVPQWFAMGVVGAESDWKADACGDTHADPRVQVGGVLYQAPFCAIKNTYACSWGLLQLNLCGGQGVGYVPENDLRIDVYWGVCLKLIFNADGTYAQWPPISGEEPIPLPPSPQQTALLNLKCELLGIQASSGRSLRTVRQLLIDLYGDTSGQSLESLLSELDAKS